MKVTTKRLVSVLMALVMMVSLLPVTALAEGWAGVKLAASPSVETKELVPGESFTVTVSLSNNLSTGISGLFYDVTFDKSAFELDGDNTTDLLFKYGKTSLTNLVENDGDAASANSKGVFSPNLNMSAYTKKKNNFSENGDVLTMTFKIKDGAAPGKKDFTISNVRTTQDSEAKKDGVGSGCSITLLAAPIAIVSFTLDAPQKGVALPSLTALGSGYTGTVEWYEGNGATGSVATGNAKPNQVYTAKVTLTADTSAGESFDASLNGKTTAEGYKIKVVDTSKLELTKTFKATASKDTPTITADPTASAITYGQKLSDSTLTGGKASFGSTEVKGTFAWKSVTTAPQVKDSNSTEYEVIFTPTDTANYETATCKVKLEVKPKNITPDVTLSADEYTYTGNQCRPVVTVKDGSTALAATDYELTYSANTDVGTAHVKVAPKTGSNYTFTAVDKPFTIKAASRTITIGSYTGKTYDGTAVAEPTNDQYTVSAGTGTVTFQFFKKGESTPLSTAPVDAGEYTVVATVAAAGNYAAATSAAKAFTIAPKPVTEPTFEGVAASYEYTGSSISPVVTLKDGTAVIPAGEYEVKYTKNTDVGTATITVTNKAGGNYTVSGSKTFTITAKTITPTVTLMENGAAVTASTYTYTGKDIKPTVEVKNGGSPLTEGTDYTVTYAANRDAGSAQVIVKAVAGKNYTFTDKTESFTINPAKLTVADPTVNVRVGDTGEKTFTAADLQVSFNGIPVAGALNFTDFAANAIIESHTALADGFKFSVKSGAVDGATAVTQDMTFTPDSGNFAPVSGIKLTVKVVNKQPVSDKITFTDGGVTFNGAGQKYEHATISGFDSKKITYSYAVSGTGALNSEGLPYAAGSYTVTARYEDNDNMGEKTATFTIKPKTLTAAMIAGIPAQTYTGSAIQPKPAVTDSVALVEGVDFTYNYDANTNVATGGKVTITGKGNYTGNAFATFTIAPKPLAADMFKDIANVTYDGTAKTPTVTAAASEAHLTTADFTVAYTNNTNAGTATVTITGKGNYKGTASKTFIINAKAITDTTVTANVVGASFTYNGKDITPAVTVSDGSRALRSGTDYTVTYGGNKNAGTATVTIAGKGNYADSRTVNFTISPKQVNFTATVDGKTYDGTDTIPAANIKNITVPAGEIVKGDTVTVTGTASAVLTDGTDAGSHKAKVTLTGVSISNSNYELKKDADGNYTCIVSNVGVSPLAKTDTAVNLDGSTMTKGTEAEAETMAKAIVNDPGMTEETKKALGITDGMTVEEKVAAAKKALAGKAGQSETNSQLLKLSGTAGGALVIPYPDTVTSRFTIKITLLKADGTMGEPVVLESADKMAAGLKLTAAEGLYLLSWKAPSSGGSGSGSSSYGSGAHTFTTDLTGINLVKVDNKVVPSKYYTISGSDVTLSAEFMSTLSNGKHTIAIENATKVARATFTVSSNDKATYQPTSKEPTQAPGEIVKVTVDSGKATVTAVYVDGVKLSGKDYVLSGKTVKLQGTYTQKLSVGYHTLQVDYSNGATATARFEIKGAVVSPKTGDASVYLYAAMALMSGTGAAYVTLRRKKEN